MVSSATVVDGAIPFAEGARPNHPVPRAGRRPKVLEQFGETREDPYYWLRSDTRDDPDVGVTCGVARTVSLARPLDSV